MVRVVTEAQGQVQDGVKESKDIQITAHLNLEGSEVGEY